MTRQSEAAIAEADVVLLVLDVTAGVTDLDARVADLLRRRDAPVIVVANKVDDPGREPMIWELMGLGLGEPFPVSALHGRGTGDLLDEVLAQLPAAPEQDEDGTDVDGDGTGADPDGPRTVSVALVGRPNVGKSTLFNRLIGEDRAVVHDLPGTTRDSIDTVVETEVGRLRFVDTAGMRRRSRIDHGTEWFSMVRALAAVDAADVALLVIDATEGITHQDQRLAERVDGAGCPIIVVLNKWELLDAEARDEVLYQVRRKLHFLGEAAVLRLLRVERPRGAPAAPCAGRVHRPVPDPRADPAGQRHDPPCPTGTTGAPRRADPLRHPGRDRPADLHALHEPRDPGELPALHRAPAARRLRSGVHPREAARAPPR